MDFFMSAWLSRTALYFAIALPCAAADRATLQVPRATLRFLMFVMLASSPFCGPEAVSSFKLSLSGAGAGMLAFFAVRKLSYGGLGLADVWMAGATGALGGPLFCARAALAAVVLVLPAVLPAAIKNTRKPVPFLPALATGSFFSILSVYFSGKY